MISACADVDASRRFVEDEKLDWSPASVRGYSVGCPEPDRFLAVGRADIERLDIVISESNSVRCGKGVGPSATGLKRHDVLAD